MMAGWAPRVLAVFCEGVCTSRAVDWGAVVGEAGERRQRLPAGVTMILATVLTTASGGRFRPRARGNESAGFPRKLVMGEV